MFSIYQVAVFKKSLPSGKRLQIGESPCLMGKLTISMAVVSSSQTVSLPEGIPIIIHQCPIIIPIKP